MGLGGCGCLFQGGQIRHVGTRGSKKAFGGGQAWAAIVSSTVTAPWCHPRWHASAGPRTLCLVFEAPPTLSGEASWGPFSAGSVDSWPLQAGPYSQDPGPQSLLSGLQAGTFWSPGLSLPCLLTCTAALPVTESCVPQGLIGESHSEGAAPRTLP